jgi:hypothetical protein
MHFGAVSMTWPQIVHCKTTVVVERRRASKIVKFWNFSERAAGESETDL